MPEPLQYLPIPLGMMIAGSVILVWRNRTRAFGHVAPGKYEHDLVATLSWTLVLLGLFGAVGLVAWPLFIPAWVILAMVLPSLAFRFRSTERRSLLWTLMLASERDIPLETAARAFAGERHDHIGARAFDLAEYLEAGLPLALALRRSRLHFPESVLLSAELGQQTGNLGGALRRSLGTNDETGQILRNASERLLYLIFLVLFASVVLTFMMLKIVPAFLKILDEFGLEAPSALKLLVGVTGLIAHYWLIPLVAFIVLVIVADRAIFRYAGTSPASMPWLVAGWQCADRSVIMHWLAHAVRQNRPLPEMMRLIAGYVTRAKLRRRLQKTARRIDQGVDWIECLEDADIVRRPEAAVFRAAERSGNLAWALDEMSESNTRRTAYRLRAFVNVAFPLATIVMGAFVLLVALGLLSPLFQLISSLS